MERMANVRLLDLFDQKGGTTKRKTIDHLLSLEITVRKTHANSEQVVSMFFDMGNAYDFTWRHSILMDILWGTEVRSPRV